jgi:outer membrane receptor protein involved in Fe transport
MRRFDRLILSSVSLVALTAAPAFAQTPAPVETTPEKTTEGEQTPPSSEPTNAQGEPEAADTGDDAIVVTGSRIRRDDNFNTPQNVDILTRDDQVLAGSRSLAETLQSGTVTSGTSQISGSFLGYLSEGGQGANLIGLRGLGATRTLVLLNGRRLAPAGAGNQLVAADLNVLPTSIVQRIEILREGASSIYGSDAIAGVVNIITDTKLDGITFDAFGDSPLQFFGGGRTYRGSAVAGKTFARGHITGAFEFRRDKGLRLGDNPDWRCPRELAFQNGKEVGQGSPLDPNELRCFPFQRDGLGTARGYGIIFDFENGVLYRGAPAGYETGNPTLSAPPTNVNNFNLRPLASGMELETHVISPNKTLTGYLNGAYELGALGDAELYGEALFTRRKSRQDTHTQLNFQGITNGGFYGEAQLYGGTYFGYDLCDFGCATSPFYPTAWAAGGVNYFGPFIVPNRLLHSSQKVDFLRTNAGLRGSTGLGDWRYDANLQISRTRAKENLFLALTERVNNILVAVPAPAGTPNQYVTVALPGQTGAGNSYTCAANVTDGAYNGGKCVPINFYDPNVFLNGNIPDALFDYVYENNIGRTRYKQDTLNITFDGSLFELPGGPVKAAIGFEHRRDSIDDIPSEARQNGELYAYSTVGRTKGSDRVNEAFGEIQLPILKDRPFANLLEVGGSARWTNYRSYGSDITYALRAQYSPHPIVRFRGNYGTNFRAPNLYEQFVGNEQGFYAGSYDPCDEFASAYDPSDPVYQRCLGELTPILDNPATPANEALNYFTTGSIEVFTSGGGDLEAETAKTWGLGAVFTAPRSFADLTLAVDFWRVAVRDEVSQLGNLILFYCYNEDDYPDNPYCNLIGPRNPGNAIQQPGEISSFQNPYLNLSRQIAKGIDFDARFATSLLGGRFQTQLQGTRMLSQKLEYFEGSGIEEYNGTFGYPGAGSGPKWVGSLDTRFTTANDITFRWGVEYVGRQQEDPDPFLINGEPAEYDNKAEPYWEHGASVQYLWRNVGQFTLGVNNLFNAKPPRISSNPQLTGDIRLGNFFANGPYSYRGRSFFINVTRSFK